MAARKEPGAEAFGGRIRARREELSLSRRDLVEAAGLSYPYVSQVETGYRLPSHKALAALAEALEMSPSELSASIPYEEALASSDCRVSRKPRSPRSGQGWYGNPQDAAMSAEAAPSLDTGHVAREVVDLVGDLPRDQRLDALSLAQRQVMENLVAEEVEDRRER